MSHLNQLPERVIFSNTKDGVVFFDCTPDEAELAKQVIEKVRKDDNLESKATALKKRLSQILSMTPVEDKKEIEVVAQLSGDSMADVFAKIEQQNLRVTEIVMNARDYADLRKFDRDILEFVDDVQLVKTGNVCILWGARVFVNKTVPTDQILFAAVNDTTSQMHVFRYAYTTVPAPTPEPTIEERIEEKLDRLLEIVDPRRTAKKEEK